MRRARESERAVWDVGICFCFCAYSVDVRMCAHLCACAYVCSGVLKTLFFMILFVLKLSVCLSSVGMKNAPDTDTYVGQRGF